LLRRLRVTKILYFNVPFVAISQRHATCTTMRAAAVLLTAVLVPTQALVLQRGRSRAATGLGAGFGAATAKTKKKTFVSAGKKDLEKQWESFVALQRKGSRLFACESVWARAAGGDDWLRVGAVVTRDDGFSNAEAVAAQKKLIAWTAEQLHLPLSAARGRLEFGLGPYVDDDADGADGDGGDASKVVAAVGAGAKAAAVDVGFKPVRSPLAEHQTSVAGALLNKSTGKGSAKFKGAAAGSATAAGAADSKGVLS